MKNIATVHRNELGAVWMNVPNRGLYPVLLLEILSGAANMALVDSLDQRGHDVDVYGLEKYTQVHFKPGIDAVRVTEIADYINLNARE